MNYNDHINFDLFTSAYLLKIADSIVVQTPQYTISVELYLCPWEWLVGKMEFS